MSIIKHRQKLCFPPWPAFNGHLVAVIIKRSGPFLLASFALDIQPLLRSFRGGSGNLDSGDKWIFCLNAA